MTKNLVGKVVSLRCYGALFWVNVESVDRTDLRGVFTLRACYGTDGRRAINGMACVGESGLFESPTHIRILKRGKIVKK